MNWPSTYFAPKELLSPDGLALRDRGIMPISIRSVESLDRIRESFNTPMYVNHGWLSKRGFRSPRENYEIYGEHRYTFHFWCAFDVTQDKMPVEDFYNDLLRDREKFSIGGLGLYKDSNFVHIDFRAGDFATWVKK